MLRISLKTEIMVVMLLLASAWIYALYQTIGHDVPSYRQDNGETYIAFHQAEQIDRHFSRTGMLHVEEQNGRNLVYTHNVNIGSQYAALLRCFGLRTFHSFLHFIPPIFIAGLLIAYITIRTVTKSIPCALIFLILMVTDFNNVVPFASNALRSWHLSGFFLCAFAGYLLSSNKSPTNTKLSGICVVGGGIVCFGCGYDFYVIGGAVLFLVLMFFSEHFPSIKKIACIAVLFALPFVIRQAEVMFWLGPSYWFTDVYYTAAIKIPFLSNVLLVPPLSAVQEFYDSLNVLRPPALPSSSITDVLNALNPMLESLVIPRFGSIALSTAFIATCIGILDRLVGPFPSQFFSNGYRLVAATTLGALVGLSLFATFSFHVYLKHNFPLLVFIVYLSTSVAVVTLIDISMAQIKGKRLFNAALGVSALAVITLNVTFCRLTDYYYPEGLSFRWLTDLEKITKVDGFQGADCLVFFNGIPHVNHFSELYSPLTTRYPSKPTKDAFGILSGKLNTISADTSPTLVVYAPSSPWCNFDAAEPSHGRRDLLQYLYHAKVFYGKAPDKQEPLLHSTSSAIVELNPRDNLEIRFNADRRLRRIVGKEDNFSIVLSAKGVQPVTLCRQHETARQNNGEYTFRIIYNNIHNVLTAYIKAGVLDIFEGKRISLQVIYDSGENSAYSDPVTVDVSSSVAKTCQEMPKIEPSIDTVFHSFANNTAIKRTGSYIIFRVEARQQ